jgi:hypothetical protein
MLMWALMDVDITTQAAKAHGGNKEKGLCIPPYYLTSSINKKIIRNFAAGTPPSDGIHS